MTDDEVRDLATTWVADLATRPAYKPRKKARVLNLEDMGISRPTKAPEGCVAEMTLRQAGDEE